MLHKSSSSSLVCCAEETPELCNGRPLGRVGETRETFDFERLQEVHRYLEHGPQLPLNLRQVDPLIRQLTLYRDLIQARTQQDSTTPNEETPHESD